MSKSALAPELLELIKKSKAACKPITVDDDTLERLRKSKAEFIVALQVAIIEAKALGKENGAEWAKRRASYEHLVRLDDHEEFGELDSLAHEVADVLKLDNPDALGDNWLDESADYVSGFIDGALEVWQAVKAKLDAA